jgi:methionyl-tRNA formyltransferase
MSARVKLAIMATGPVGGSAIEIMLDADSLPTLAVIDGNLNGRAERIRKRLCDKGYPNAVVDVADTSPAKLAALISAHSIDVVILAWWPHIITEPLLSAPRSGFLNFHPSFLPYNRGRHSFFWNLVEDVPFGVTIHWIDSGIDSGPIAFQQRVSKSWLDTSESLYERAQCELLDLFRRRLSDIAINRIPRLPQNSEPTRTHYAKEIQSATQIDLDMPHTARRLFNLIRGAQFGPYAPAYFEDSGELFEVRISIKRKKE